MPVVTPWGSADVALDQVAAFISGTEGTVGGWLLLEDGSRVEVFVGEGTFMVGTKGGGTVPAATLLEARKRNTARRRMRGRIPRKRMRSRL